MGNPLERVEDLRRTIERLRTAFQESRVLLTAVELELFSVLDSGADTPEAAAALTGTEPAALRRLLDALAVLGIVTRRQGGRYGLDDAARSLLVPGSPDWQGGLGHAVNLWESWSTLTDAVRTGTSPRRRHHGLQDPERTRRFIGAMDHLGRARAHAVVSLLDLTGVRRVLDVGGASGAYAAEFVRQGRNLRATVTDLPEVLPLTRRYLDDGGMADRVDTLPGDYHVDGFGEGWDLVFLSNVIHINSAEENAGLVARSAAALAPGGRLVIQDFVPSEDRSGPPHAVLFSLNMLVNTRAGDTYTLSEIRSWTDAAGLSWLPPVETGVPSTLVIARKP